MSKIALKMVEEIQLSWEYCQVFHPYSIYKNQFFLRNDFIHKNQKNQSCLRTKYRELSWAIKYFFALLQKVNNSIATKLCVNLINTCTIFLKKNVPRHNSMTKLCYTFLNMKINWKLVEKSNAHFWSALKWERV